MSKYVDVKFNLLPGMDKQIERGISGEVRKTTITIRDGARRRSRVDTGAMREGWLEEFVDALNAIVYNGVPYTIYHEYGKSDMAAQPMGRPAAEEQREPFKQGIIRVLQNLGK